MRGAIDWRSPDYGDQFKGFERPMFAQECLCRNRDYVDDLTQAKGNQAALKEVARRWGLGFPGRASPIGQKPTRPVATRDPANDRHLDRRRRTLPKKRGTG